jgi:hypothetical protein
MGLAERFKSIFGQREARNIADYFMPTNSEPYFLDTSQQILSVGQDVIGLTDHAVSAHYLYEIVTKDTYFGGLFEQLVDNIFENDFYFQQKKGESGKLGNKYFLANGKDILEENGYRDLITELVYGLRGDGGGNSLLMTTRNGSKLELRVENFLADGVPRVRVHGDQRNRMIIKYEVIDQIQMPVYTLDPKANFVKHIRYQRGGNYMFSTNPAKKAVYWYILKNRLAGATLSGHKNGFQEPYIVTTDYSQIKSIMEAMGNSQISANTTREELRDPLKFISKQAEITDAILRSHIGDNRNTGQVIRLPLPAKIEKIGKSSQDLSTIEWLKICDEQIGYALRSSKGIIDTKDSKYANAEIEKDNWSSFVVDSLKTQLEKITLDYIIPILIPNYDATKYEFKLGREPSEEDMKIFEVKTRRNSSIATIIQKLSTVDGYEYDLEEDVIVKNPNMVSNATSKEKNDSVKVADTQDLKTEESKKVMSQQDEDKKKAKYEKEKQTDKIMRQYRKKHSIEEVSEDFANWLKRGIEKQLNERLDTLRGYTEDSKEADIETQVLPINRFGVNVVSYKGKLSKAVNNFLNADVQIRFRDIKREVEDMIDARAEMMIKGIGSMSKERQGYVLEAFGKEFSGYAGFDKETSQIISDIVSKAYKEGRGIKGATEDLKANIEGISDGRAKLIAHTDVAQSIEAVRYTSNIARGMDMKTWNTMQDSKVRQTHVDTQGETVPVEADFSTGVNRPSWEFQCRCNLTYSRDPEKLNSEVQLFFYDDSGVSIDSVKLTKRERDFLIEHGIKMELTDEIGSYYNGSSLYINPSAGLESILTDVGKVIDDQLGISDKDVFQTLFRDKTGLYTDEGIKVLNKWVEEFGFDEQGLQSYLGGKPTVNKTGQLVPTDAIVQEYITDMSEIFAFSYMAFVTGAITIQETPTLFNYFNTLVGEIEEELLWEDSVN